MPILHQCFTNMFRLSTNDGMRRAVTQLVKALHYILEGRGFDSRWCSSCRTYDAGVDSASNRNEYQEYFLGIKAAGA
jgi:hypothetical protein